MSRCSELAPRKSPDDSRCTLEPESVVGRGNDGSTPALLAANGFGFERCPGPGLPERFVREISLSGAFFLMEALR